MNMASTIRASCTASIAIVLGAMLTPGAFAQSQQLYGLPIHKLTPVDERVGDVGGSLSTSLRQIDPGLAVPSGFEQVYRVPGHNDLLMRIEGGVMAVFPESVYSASANGSVPVVPPNTTFYIGLPQMEALLQYADAANSRPSTGDPRLDLKIAQTPRVYDVPTARPPASKAGSQTVSVVEPGPRITYQRPGDGGKPRRVANTVELDDAPAIVVDDEYRAQRMRELIQRAAAARSQ